MKSCRDSVCKLEFFGCPVFSSASVPCGICNCACSLRQTEVFSDFSLLVRTVRLPTFLFCFLDCRNEASRLRSLKQIVKFCRASVCKLELWLSGPQFCFYTLWDFNLRLFTSANCEVFSDFSLLVRTVRLLSFLFCFFLDYVGMKHCGFVFLSKLSGFSLQVGVFWLSGLQFCFCTLWDFHLRLFTSANCEVFSDFSFLVRTVRLLSFLFFGLCWNEALRLRSLKQVVKSCRDSVCKLEFFGCPVFSSASVPCGMDLQLRMFTSANCEVFSDFSLLVRTVRLLSFLFCFFFGLCWNEALRLRFLKQIVGLQFASWSFLAVRSSVLLLYPVGFAIALVHFSKL